MADIERFDRLLAEIEAHPERHFQGSWLVKVDCGTGGCLAGLAVLDAYPDAVPHKPSTWLDDRTTYDEVKLANGAVLDVESQGAELLGLTAGQSCVVFASKNTLEQLKAMRDVLAANAHASIGALEAAQEAAE